MNEDGIFYQNDDRDDPNKPHRCLFCDSVHLKEEVTNQIEGYVCESKVICLNCGEETGYWGYGSYEPPELWLKSRSDRTKADRLAMAEKLMTFRHGVSFLEVLIRCTKNEQFMLEFDRLHKTSLYADLKPIEKMIDQATGKTDAELQQLIDFVWDVVFLRFGGKETT